MKLSHPSTDLKNISKNLKPKGLKAKDLLKLPKYLKNKLKEGLKSGSDILLTESAKGLSKSLTGVTPMEAVSKGIGSALELVKTSKSKEDEKVDNDKKADTKENPKTSKRNEDLKKAAIARKAHAASLRKNKTFGTLKKPGVFFIGGANIFSSGSLNNGLKDMSEAVKDSKYFEWDEDDLIMEEIKKRSVEQPIVLVGHSFGGDTAIEIAQELNSLENKFRNIALIVTIDSLGLSNDLVPQNVKTNLNFIGNSNSLLNDGPNIALNSDLTSVFNELRSEDHSEIDESKEVQMKIVNNIENILSNHRNIT